MSTAQTIMLVAVALLGAKWGMEIWLAWLNRRHVLTNAAEVPAAFKDTIDPATYAKSVEYTLAKSRLGIIEDSYGLALTLVLLLSGVLPLAFDRFVAWRGDSAAVLAAMKNFG